MTERAKSVEILKALKKENVELSQVEKDGSIYARVARDYHFKNILKDNNFFCINCGAALKCSGWEDDTVKRVYFYLKNRKKDKNKHRNCSNVSGKKGINTKLVKNNNLLMNKEKRIINDTQLNEVFIKRFPINKDMSKINNKKRKKDNIHSRANNSTSVSFIASLLELYRDKTKRNLKCRINGESIKLKDLFVNTQNNMNLPKNTFRIFYGPAKVKVKNKNLLLITPDFLVNDIPSVSGYAPIATNLYYLRESAWAPEVVNVLRNNSKEIWYFLGKVDESNNFVGFNKSMYKNLYVE
ncbi:hypothetical protein [Lactobacillus sp. PV034]|uniref:hypothetical protein n=1 Tax=Lactobacillus sp. PV034 TaxID=2594495 RepID=UPI002240A6F4|nr:hypothetical protein [Lactobacillus sp. PV034]QNQ80516.1 hypothetical protein FP432_02595 [Lactobacillus sp. PV034]